ncbi:hypothetical protein ABMA46_10200 [Mesorhizobium sp. CN5-321]|uniref:hypothetical protein n=1 Tax=Mesorhizobium hunchu TaxID=3157708 RepID=UPI0032B744BE
MAKASAADVKKARIDIEVDGEPVTLIPSPDAIITLSRAYDGFKPLLDAISRFNFDAISGTIVAGAGVDGKDARDMTQKVAKTNIIELVPPLTAFVMILLNGGKPLADDDGEKENADPSRS